MKAKKRQKSSPSSPPIGAADLIRLLMRKLTLDRIGMPFAAFVQER